MRVLITDGNERSSLAVTRALGQQQIHVTVGAETERSLAGVSRYCSRAFHYPSPCVNPKGFVDALLERVISDKIGMLVPMSDLALQLVGERRSEFDARAVLPTPPLHVYETVSDKYRLTQLADKLGVPVPDTLFVEDGNLPQDLSVVGGFPLLVKPGRSWMLVDGTWTRTMVHQVKSRGELGQLYGDMPYLRYPSLLQRRLEGEGRGIFAICNHGTPLALFAHRRLREKPPSGGVSVLRESIELSKPMVDYAVRLLQNVSWHGVAMVEFKMDSRTGIPFLMEINGRFWGSLQLAIDAGINFPFLLYQLSQGQPVTVLPPCYQVGVKSRWLLGDMDHLLLRMLNSDEALRLPSGYPSRWECAREFMRFFQKDLHYEVERWDDSAPARYELRMYLKALVKRHT